MRGAAAQGRVQAVETHDVLVVGSGVGGLTVALETPGLRVGLLTKTALGRGGSSPMAQGGVAAAVGPGDSPAAHAEDTLAAAAGLAVPERVRILTEEGPARVAALLALGTRFDRDDGGDLAQRRQGHRTLLDARDVLGTSGPGGASRFPTAVRHCRAHGFDPSREPVPVSPAAHYHMGGIAVDPHGRTSMAGLWACGEVSCVGMHGANRLASNSLLDALVFGARVGRDLTREVRGLPPAKALVGRHDDRLVGESIHEGAHGEIRGEIRDLMWRDVGLVRTQDGLQQAIQGLAGIGRRLGPGSSETHNLLMVAGAITEAAYARRDSRGAHFRADHPSDPDTGHESTG